jgi:myo-inositol-1(or 4)-monophosphatase
VSKIRNPKSEIRTDSELDEFLEAATEAARRAALVLAQWRRRFSVREKGPADLVTEADLASQQAIRDYLHGRFPSHDFLGEEDKNAGARTCPGDVPRWIVDPIDGTTNYVHDFPLYCISIGLEIDGELAAGVILEPTRQELFRAAKGRGAWLGDERLQVSPVQRLEEALLTTGFPPHMREQDKLFKSWEYFSLRAQSVRRTGSTALNLAYLAAGRCEAFWAFDNHVWDVAAGVVLVREAGGKITRADGSNYDPYGADCVASNGGIHELMLEGVRNSRH